MLLAPKQHLLQNWYEALSQLCQGILDSWRYLRKDRPPQEAVGLQFPQLFGQGGLGDAVQTAHQFPEPLDLIEGYIPQNQYFPLTAQHRLQAWQFPEMCWKLRDIK